MLFTGHRQPEKISLVGIQKTHAFAATQGTRSKSYAAFTLLELLVVVVIMCVMLSLLAPAVGSMTSTGGRKGAVTIVMNTLEQARMAAIEKSRDVVVVFWKKNGTTTAADEQDAILVLRRDDSNNWEPIGRWVKLPKGVLFHGEDAQSEILKQNSSALAEVTDAAISALPGNPIKVNLGAVQFSSSGAVQLPSTSIGLRIALTEGQRDSSGTLAVKKQKSGGYEVISVARYTGRPTLDITSL
jgi:prepilin-type N-terminal cleavage/methylation domain-containing protein